MDERVFTEEKVKEIIVKVEVDVKILSAEYYLNFIETIKNPIEERFDFLTGENRTRDEEWIELHGKLNALGIVERELRNTLNKLIEKKKSL